MFLLIFILMLVTQHALGVEVIEGAESVVLPCKATPGAASSVTWTREDLDPKIIHFRKKAGQAEEDDHTNQNQLFTNRTEVHPDALRTGLVSLTLKHIEVSDGGIYSCNVRGGGRLDQTHVQLQVTSKEEVELREQARRQRDIGIAVGIIILCIVAAVLGWLYRSGYIGEKVPQVQVDPGEESVLLPCRTIRLLPNDVSVKWTAGDRMVHVSLKGSDQPGEQDDLYKGRTEMKRNLRILVDLSLTLTDPTWTDSEIYTCTVYSRGGDVLMERHVMLEVKVQKVVVYSGEESVLLPCKATGQLPEDVRVQWTDGDKKKLHVSLKGSDQPGEQDDLYRGRTEMKRETPGDLSLTLKRPTESDGNFYTCTVYSREGDVLMKRHVQLLVTGSSGQQEVDSGAESVLLPCEGTGQLHEDVRVEWTDGHNLIVHVSLKGSDPPQEQDDLYRGRTEMKRDLQGPGDLSLTLKHPTVRDRKTYTCTVYSREGKVLMERHMELKVTVCPVMVEQGAESVLLPFKTRELPEDVRVTWRRLNPMKTVHVFQDGSDQQDQQDPSYRGRTEMWTDLRQGDVSLTLNHPTERDGGRYSCRVYSKEGDIRREKTVYLYITVRQVKEEESDSLL